VHTKVHQPRPMATNPVMLLLLWYQRNDHAQNVHTKPLGRVFFANHAPIERLLLLIKHARYLFALLLFSIYPRGRPCFDYARALTFHHCQAGTAGGRVRSERETATRPICAPRSSRYNWLAPKGPLSFLPLPRGNMFRRDYAVISTRSSSREGAGSEWAYCYLRKRSRSRQIKNEETTCGGFVEGRSIRRGQTEQTSSSRRRPTLQTDPKQMIALISTLWLRRLRRRRRLL